MSAGNGNALQCRLKQCWLALQLIRAMKLALVKQTAEAAKQCECKAVKRAKTRHQKATTINNDPMQDTGDVVI